MQRQLEGQTRTREECRRAGELGRGWRAPPGGSKVAHVEFRMQKAGWVRNGCKTDEASHIQESKGNVPGSWISSLLSTFLAGSL